MTAPSPPLPPLTRRRVLHLLGAAAAALGAVAGCGGGGSAPTGGTPGTSPLGLDPADLDALQGRTLRVATFEKNHASAPLYWPQFAPPGLDVQVRTLTSGTDMNVALEAGDLDFALFGLVNGFVQAEQGIGSRVVCMGAEKGAAVVVAADGPVQTVGDLAGRVVGFKGPSFQYLLLLELLESAGLDPVADVTLVPVEWNDMPAALARGDVDAYAGTEPNPARSLADGAGRALRQVYETPVGSLNSCIWASRRVVAEEPAMLRAATRMQRAAAEHLTPGGRNDPAVWRDLTVEQFGYPVEVFEALLPNVGAVWRFDDARRGQAEAAGRRMLSLGLLAAEPAYDDLLELSAQPER